MSSSPDAEIIAEYDSLFVSLCCSFAALTFLGYDWLLCLHEEIEYFWTRRVSAASILYFLIRYLLIIFWVMGYPTDNIQGVVCDVYMYTIQVLQLLIYVFPALLSTLRVYALTAQNKVLAALVLFFALGPIYANAIHYGWLEPVYLGPEFGGCGIVDNAGHRLGVIYSATSVTGISRGMLFVADLLVIIITWTKTSFLAKNMEGTLGESTLSKTMLHSGVVYFIPLAILNLLHTILTETGANQFLRNSSLVSVFIDPATSVLACRLLLSLHSVERANQNGRTGSQAADGATTTIHFTTPTGRESEPGRPLPPFIASLGEFVDTAFIGGDDFPDDLHAKGEDEFGTELAEREHWGAAAPDAECGALGTPSGEQGAPSGANGVGVGVATTREGMGARAGPGTGGVS